VPLSAISWPGFEPPACGWSLDAASVTVDNF